jgi:hypothetical protein
MHIVVSRYFIPKGFRGLTIFPFILLKHKRDKEDACLLNHEKIHIRQQLELFILPFFIWYGIEYVIKFLYYRNSNLAYRNISFEREAYLYENDLSYLKTRSFWAFLPFLKN